MNVQKKLVHRGFLILTYAANNLISMSFNVLLSLVIVKLFSMEWWGELVPYLIIFQLCSFFVSWGSQIYLQREFAKQPHKIGQVWLDNVLVRASLMLLAALVILFLQMPVGYKLSMIAWMAFNYGYRSYESLILYQRKFTFSLLLNMSVALSFITLVFFYKDKLSVGFVMILYLLAEGVKLVACMFYFYKDFTNISRTKNSFTILLMSFPFFLQGLVGLLQSRIDTYYVAFALSKEELAKYHILISFLLLIKAIIDMFLRPFLKNIYRMSVKKLKKIALRFLGTGIIASVLIVAGLYVILTYLYGFHLDIYILLLSYLFILPMYYYATLVYIYYKFNKEKIIVLFGAIIVCFNLLLDIWLVSRYGIEGALTTAVIQEWIMLGLCVYFVPQSIKPDYAKG